MNDAIAAEWLKIRSVSSTYYLLAGLAAVALAGEAMTFYGVHAWDASAGRTHVMVTPPDQLTGLVGEVIFGVLGVLAITVEYATGTIRTTLLAVPQRRVLLGAKATVLTATALGTGTAVLTAAFVLSRLIVGHRPMQFYTAPASHEIPMLLALIAAITVATVLGLSLGAVLRSSAGGITMLAAIWLVLPVLAQQLPSPWNTWLASALPINLPAELAGTRQATGPHLILPPAAAAAVMAGYAVAALAAATTAFSCRDA